MMQFIQLHIQQMKFQFEQQEVLRDNFQFKNQAKNLQYINDNQNDTDLQKRITSVDQFLNAKLKTALQINKILKKQTKILNSQSQSIKQKQQKISKAKSQQKMSQHIFNYQNNVQQKQRNVNMKSLTNQHFLVQNAQQQSLHQYHNQKVKQAKKQQHIGKNTTIKNTIMSLGYPSVQKNAVLGFKTNKMPYRFNRFS